MKRIVLSAVLVGLGLLGAPELPLASAADCETYEGNVNGTGIGGQAYIKTELWACIAHNADKCSITGNRLYMKNVSKRHRAYITMELAGLRDWPVEPSEEQVHTIAVYRRPDAPPLSGRISIRWCRLNRS
jgi:hypothetical protein